MERIRVCTKTSVSKWRENVDLVRELCIIKPIQFSQTRGMMPLFRGNRSNEHILSQNWRHSLMYYRNMNL